MLQQNDKVGLLPLAQLAALRLLGYNELMTNYTPVCVVCDCVYICLSVVHHIYTVYMYMYTPMNMFVASRPLEVCIMEYFQHQLSLDSTSDQSSEAAEYTNSTITQLGGDSLTAMRLSEH